MNENRPCIGISQCLTNSIVRYDAKTEFNKNLVDALSQHFELLAICPEVECGLGMPRPPVELVETDKEIKVLGRDNKSLDVSDSLISYSRTKILSLAHLSGYVFKARSPSCGVESTPVYSLDGSVKRYSNGIFVEALIKQYPAMPVIDDAEIIIEERLSKFMDAINCYAQTINNEVI